MKQGQVAHVSDPSLHVTVRPVDCEVRSYCDPVSAYGSVFVLSKQLLDHVGMTNEALLRVNFWLL